MPRRERAFTLVELLVTIALIAMVATLAIPALSGLIRRNAMTTTLNRLTASLHLARSTAVTQGLATVVCPGTPAGGCDHNGHWEDGWLAFSDPAGHRDCRDADGDRQCDNGAGALLRVTTEPATPRLTLRATGNPHTAVVYKPSGFADGYAGTFSLCDGTHSVAPRGLTLALTGRVRVADASNLQCPPN